MVYTGCCNETKESRGSRPPSAGRRPGAKPAALASGDASSGRQLVATLFHFADHSLPHCMSMSHYIVVKLI